MQGEHFLNSNPSLEEKQRQPGLRSKHKKTHKSSKSEVWSSPHEMIHFDERWVKFDKASLKQHSSTEGAHWASDKHMWKVVVMFPTCPFS